MVGLHNATPDMEQPGAVASGLGSREFDAFYRAEYAPLVEFLTPRCRSVEDAQDAAQESLVRVLQYYGGLPRERWSRILYRIAINVAHDRGRLARRDHHSMHVPLHDIELTDSQPNAQQAAEQAQEVALVRTVVMELPVRCREVFILKRLHGMTCPQIASQLRISVRMVEKHLANALVHMARRLGQRGMKAQG